MSTNSLWGTLIIEELFRLGVRDICMAPGSRSTPLVAAAARHPQLNVHVFIDERSAAFFALGIGRFRHQPAVMITTSGTAIAHAYPAVIEAEASNIPLILISADRPHELHHSGANQTIDQTKLFSDHLRFFTNIPPPDSQYHSSALLTLIDQAYAYAHDGPVHLNCMFRKPLEPQEVNLEGIWPDEAPFSKLTFAKKQTPIDIPPHERAVLLIGALSDEEEQKKALNIALHAQCPIFCDAASGLRLMAIPNQLYPADILLRFESIHSFLSPDLIVHLGGSFVSKEIPTWVEKQSCAYMHISPSCARKHFRHGLRIISHLPQHLAPLVHPLDASKLQQSITSYIDDYIPSTGMSEASTVYQCVQQLPQHASIFASNSMPIRILNRLAPARSVYTRTAVNRGASGIDGIIASAAGWCHASTHPCVLIIGDLATLHDISSLIPLKQQNPPLLLCILNNGGGGIFSFLPIAREKDIFDPIFATTHTQRFHGILEAMNIPCTTIASQQELSDALNSFFTHPTFCAIELCTQAGQNVSLMQTIENDLRHCILKFLSEKTP